MLVLKNNRIIIGFIATVIFFISVGVCFYDLGEVAQSTSKEVAKQTIGEAQNILVLQEYSKPAGDKLNKIDSRIKLFDDYNNTLDRRLFVDSLRVGNVKSPGAGFYASATLGECRRTVVLLKTLGSELNSQIDFKSEEDSKNYSKRIAAYNILGRMCGGFVDAEIEEAGVAQERTQDIYDALVGVLGSDFYSAPRAEQLDILRQVFSLRDPLFFDVLGDRLFLRKKNGKIFYYLDGVEYPIDKDQGFGIAVKLIPCELGLDCANNDVSLLMKCASDGDCYASREEMLFANIASVEDRENVARILKKLVSIIHSSSVDRITP